MGNLLGIEIGGTKLQLGLGAGDGRITRLIRRTVDPPKGAEGIRAQIVEACRSLDVPVDAIGIGFGGPVEVDRGGVTKSNQIEGWDGFPLIEWARSALGVPDVVLQNDADTAALGEARFGAGRGLSPVLYVNSGSGIGGGLVIDGRIYRGAGRGAIEIGHLVASEGDHPTEDRKLTLEDLASGWAIGELGRALARQDSAFLRTREQVVSPLISKECSSSEAMAPGSLLRLAEWDPERVDAKMVARSARMGHTDGKIVLRGAVLAMGNALAHAVTLLAPRRLILGGGVSLIGDDLWLDPIRQRIEDRVFPPFRGMFDVVTAELGEDVVVHGALALARDALADADQ